MKRPSVKMIIYVAGCVIGFGIAGGASFTVAKVLNAPNKVITAVSSDAQSATTDTKKTIKTVPSAAKVTVGNDTKAVATAKATPIKATIKTTSANAITTPSVAPKTAVVSTQTTSTQRHFYNDPKFNVTCSETGIINPKSYSGYTGITFKINQTDAVSNEGTSSGGRIKYNGKDYGGSNESGILSNGSYTGWMIFNEGTLNEIKGKVVTINIMIRVGDKTYSYSFNRNVN